MKRINLLCPTIRRQHRKIGRNEACPCGKTKEVMSQSMQDAMFIAKDGESVAADMIQVPVKFKNCCGDPDNMRKVAKIKNFLRQHFVDILNKPRETSKLQAVAKKIKSLFKFGSKKK
jgi:hypothetical protein